ncbi:MAG: DUF3179 domain-containing protein [Gemmatimonadota bacterium]
MTRNETTARSLVTGALALLLGVFPACAQQRDDGNASADAARVARMLGGGERWKTDFSRISIDPREIRSGGPPKDGIPAVDRPRFESLDEADRWLADREPVIVVEHAGETKAYPLQILIWHEIVNDEVGGKPLTITFCPLCNTALVFEREVEGRILDFGTTGRLRHSDLVMYDRQTESWWQQASGEGIVGTFTGTLLKFYPANTFAWATARRLYPGVRVLSRRTGQSRRYGINPYEGYDSRNAPYSQFFSGRRDPRLPAMERVVAVDLGAGWAAPFSSLEKARAINEEVEGRPFVALWAPGTASALDRARIAQSRDVGQTAVYDRRLNGRTLTLEPAEGETFRDRETGSIWDLAGRATSGELAGERLEPIPHGDYFWFAWSTFRPRTRVWERP